MPLYEYICKNCSSIFEVRQKFSDPPIEKCDKCNGNVEKLISRSAFHLKGRGWFTTDYKRKACGLTENKSEPSCACDETCPHKK